MKRLILPALSMAAFLTGCATVEATGESGAKAPRIEAVTGSRLPRSENFENYQGAKTMTRRDYQEYKASTGLKSN